MNHCHICSFRNFNDIIFIFEVLIPKSCINNCSLFFKYLCPCKKSAMDGPPTKVTFFSMMGKILGLKICSTKNTVCAGGEGYSPGGSMLVHATCIEYPYLTDIELLRRPYRPPDFIEAPTCCRHSSKPTKTSFIKYFTMISNRKTAHRFKKVLLLIAQFFIFLCVKFKINIWLVFVHLIFFTKKYKLYLYNKIKLVSTKHYRPPYHSRPLYPLPANCTSLLITAPHCLLRLLYICCPTRLRS